jgi:Cu(I)/Ag(I) efflux system membrane protein CusA/SilA
MKRIAAPMVGGLVTSFLLELLVYPAVYFLWRKRGLRVGPATEVSSAVTVRPERSAAGA